MLRQTIGDIISKRSFGISPRIEEILSTRRTVQLDNLTNCGMSHQDILVMIAIHNFRESFMMLDQLKAQLLDKNRVMTDGEITGVVKLAVFNMAVLKYKLYLVYEDQQSKKTEY